MSSSPLQDPRIVAIIAAINGFLKPLGVHVYATRAAHIALEIPARKTKEGHAMPNYELPSDEIATITIKTTNSAGAVEPIPTADVFTVTSSVPASLGAAIGADAAGNPAVVLTPLVLASPGITITVTDSSGLVQATQIVDVVADVTDKNIILDVADAAFTSQTAPTAPGP